MKNLIVIVLLGAAAWLGMTQYNSLQQQPAAVSPETSKTVSYTKCTAADGRVYFGLPPAGVTCISLENVSNDITITPGSNMATTQPAFTSTPTRSRFQCDGRQYCSQMTSRDEAEFFLANCPDMKMDGDNDGDPCENDSRF